MISLELLLVLLLGTALMSVLISVQMKWYEIAEWKSIVVSVALVLTGVWGSRIWFFIENFSFDGRSFYGAIFFAPLVFWPISRILSVRFTCALDFCAPSGCVTLALVKLQCLRDGCCAGKILYVDENHMYVRFPSQIVEMADFLLIAGVLFALSANPRHRGKIFPCFLLLYGATRFVLDFWRGETVQYALGLTAGSFWSACAFAIGLIWLVCSRRMD